MMVGQVNGMNLSGQRAQSMLVQGDKQNGGMQKGFCILTLLQLMSIFLFGMKILAWNTSMGRNMMHFEFIFRFTEEKPGRCSDPHVPPCAAYVFSLSHVHFVLV
ncbi:hypothetical protein Patl1_12317 [Pistacia atlantica]|uniref:Uncharacterized protein n=1 Tax=Pistacia atlantica TaxID=434234 RepID=A0ACC1A587_9ROSI|nr:hypothetical protein Patl1_12317 [Pistacia atlantica]